MLRLVLNNIFSGVGSVLRLLLNIFSSKSSSTLIATTNASTAQIVGATNSDGGACYLIYEPDSSGRLVQQYSRTPVPNAVGRWTPGPKKTIAGFKFQQNLGKSILIGNCSAGVQGRKNYCSGWCQYVRSAQMMQGDILLWDPIGKGLNVDVYLYTNDSRSSKQTIKLRPGVATSTNNVRAVACVPKGTPFYEGMTVDILKWLADGSKNGASTKFQ